MFQMGTKDNKLRYKSFRRTENAPDFALYIASLEYGLIDPIVIEKKEDIKSNRFWHDKVEPYHHQVQNLITFCRRLPVTLLADDVGLGKTISAGLIMSELTSRNRLNKTLIVCPKILREQWKAELKDKFDIESVVVTGKELIDAKIPGDSGAVITTYHSARLYLDKIEKSGYQMLILDEAHKLRNLYGVDKTPQVAIRFKKALQDRLFKYVLMLTATPIQNRLWDMYSLVDLLTVARGHENPFGSEGMFARRFIDDARGQARILKAEAKEEFRSVVYGYMSRIRRDDANLPFPDRIVKLNSVEPTKEERELVDLVSIHIQKLDRLIQIQILQTLVSSPEALIKLLEGMATRGTAPKELFIAAKEIVGRITITAKMNGLKILVDGLSKERPNDWRLVIFTTKRETQISIQNFLEQKKIKCGLINGDTSSKNQDTILSFKKELPEIHVIISTEAGSEGVNLQVANVLVNYDLPWNPMIVEQRIGRVQRLSSNYAHVSIFNIVLKGTFEEYIVGRLMEKLQMASHAIGDIDALLEASGVGDDSEEGFEEFIRRLVLASLAGKDVAAATKKTIMSIDKAKHELEQGEKTINSLLGGMDHENVGPQCPKFPPQAHSMSVRNFVYSALKHIGCELEEDTTGLIKVVSGSDRGLISFGDETENISGLFSTLYSPGASAFERLVSRISNEDLSIVNDIDQNPLGCSREIVNRWVNSFGGQVASSGLGEVKRFFNGEAFVRLRATVGCDSYERLVTVKCTPENNSCCLDESGLEKVSEVLSDPNLFGINLNYLLDKSSQDQGIAEFCRFYNERREQELLSTGDDQRKRKKIEDDFTPRIESVLLGFKGSMARELRLKVDFKLDSDKIYSAQVTVCPSTGNIIDSPGLKKCDRTGMVVPEVCLGKCAISGITVLKHILMNSELSLRTALPEFFVSCGLTGKQLLKDETEESSITGKFIEKSLLKKSQLSGKVAEPEFFERCDFTGIDALATELAVSQISGKKYRPDQGLKSFVSGSEGHASEFVCCSVTGVPILPNESEKCAITNNIVAPGILEKCDITGKMVLPTELNQSVISGKKALRNLFVISSISGNNLLESESIRSSKGNFCTPTEAKTCSWTGDLCHPDDVRKCEITGLIIYYGYIVQKHGFFCLEPLSILLDGNIKKGDGIELWPEISKALTTIIGKGKIKIESTNLSPNKNNIAVCAEVKTLLGLQIRFTAFVYSIQDKKIIGQAAMGKRVSGLWRSL